MVKIIFVEGNVGSGKTSALDHIAGLGLENVTILREPVEEWRNVDGHNLLSLMYTETEKYAMSFQCFVFISRMRQLLKAVGEGKEDVVAERSVVTDRYVFMETMFQENKVTKTEMAIYNNLWDFWVDKLRVGGKDDEVEVEFLYISCDTDKCYSHILKRDRPEENGIRWNYLNALNEKHSVYERNVPLWNKDRKVTKIENLGTLGFFQKVEDYIKQI